MANSRTSAPSMAGTDTMQGTNPQAGIDLRDRSRADYTPADQSTSETNSAWTIFGAGVLVVLGAFHVIEGLVALMRSEFYLVTTNDLLVTFNYTAWGWVHIIGGALVVAVGLALTTGAMWARLATMAVAIVAALINFAFLPAYPIYSVIMIGLCVVAMYAAARPQTR